LTSELARIGTIRHTHLVAEISISVRRACLKGLTATALAMFVMLLCFPRSAAQLETGSIVGIVTDSSGAVYAGRGVCTTRDGGEKVKFYLDGDHDFPTINGTGTQDYSTVPNNFANQEKHQYEEFSSPYSGLAQVIRPDGLYQSQTRFVPYRWHITDPVRFDSDLRVTIQDLGWQSGGRYLPLTDDISSVVFWCQTEPHEHFPKLPARDFLEDN